MIPGFRLCHSPCVNPLINLGYDPLTGNPPGASAKSSDFLVPTSQALFYGSTLSLAPAPTSAIRYIDENLQRAIKLVLELFLQDQQ